MYEGTVDDNEIQVATFGFNESAKSRYKSRSAVVKSWINELSNVLKNTYEQPIPILDETSLENYLNIYHGRKKDKDFSLHEYSFQKITDVLKQKTLRISFLGILIQETPLVKSIEASIDSGSTTQE